MASSTATTNNPAPAQNITRRFSSTASPTRTARSWPTSAHRSDQRLSPTARLLRLGRAARRRSGRSRADAGRIRSARTGGRGCASRASAAEDRGVRQESVRRDEDRSNWSTVSCNVGEVDVFVGPNYVLSVRKNSEHGFHGRARTLRVRTRTVATGIRFRAVRIDGRGGRSLLSDHRHARIGTGGDRSEDLFAGTRRGARQHRSVV